MSKNEISKETITLRKENDLFIRDAITGMGNILKEDLKNHYYVTTVKIGAFGNTLTHAIIMRDGAAAEIVVYAHEGLIKKNLADKTIQKLRGVLC